MRRYAPPLDGLAGSLANAGLESFEAGRHAQSDIQSAPVHRAHFPMPGKRAAGAIDTGKPSHALDRHGQHNLMPQALQLGRFLRLGLQWSVATGTLANKTTPAGCQSLLRYFVAGAVVGVGCAGAPSAFGWALVF